MYGSKKLNCTSLTWKENMLYELRSCLTYCSFWIKLFFKANLIKILNSSYPYFPLEIFLHISLQYLTVLLSKSDLCRPTIRKEVTRCWWKLHNEECHLYETSHNQINENETFRTSNMHRRWNMCKTGAGKHEEKRLLYKWDNILKLIFLRV